MDFKQKFAEKVAAIDREIYAVKLPSIETPSAEQPVGVPLYAIYKRSVPKLQNSPVMMALTKQEAEFWFVKLNKKEQENRKSLADYWLEKGVEHQPEVVVFYDIVKQETEEENLLWNDPKITQDEVSK